MRTKIVFAFLLICLLAVPGSAAVEWVQTFESHPEDEPLSIIKGDYTLTASGNGYCYAGAINDMYTPKGIVIEKAFNDYLGFDLRTSTEFDNRLTLTISNSTGSVAYSGVIASLSHSSSSRIEIEETAGSNGINIYINGVLAGSSTYTNAAAVDGTGNITLKIVQWASGSITPGTGYFDNIVSFTSAVVGGDDYADYKETYQYFDVGYPVLSDSYWHVKLYSPSNVLVSTKNVTSFTTYTFNTSLMNESGSYSIKLYQHYNVTNKDYFFAERSFDFSMPAAGSISVNVSEADLGNRIKITSVLNEYADDYTVRVTSSGTLLQTYEIDGAIKSYYYTIPENLTSNYLFVYLVDPNGDVVDFEQIKILNNVADPSLTLDKDTYTNNDTIYVYYYWMPIGTKLTATYYYNGDSVRSDTVTLNDVVGSEAFTIGGTVADLVFIEAYDDDTNEVYTSATANILRGSYRISGKVYDAETGAPVEDATVISEGFSATTNSLGEYSGNTFPGNNTITVAATGYKDLHAATFVNSVNFVQNFYLVPEYVSDSGSSLYGSVTDYYTGDPVVNARILLRNGTASYTKYSDANGYYYFDNAALVGSWTVRVTADNYDNYQKTVTISGDTYLGIRLVPEGGAPDAEDVEPEAEVDTTNYSAQPYGAMGRHPFDFNGDGSASADEWKYAFERIIILVGCLCFMGFLGIVGRAGRR